MIARRSFLRGALALFAAPAIVRAASLMDIKPVGNWIDMEPMGGINARAIAALLLPGIRQIIENPRIDPELDVAWDRLFAIPNPCPEDYREIQLLNQRSVAA